MLNAMLRPALATLAVVVFALTVAALRWGALGGEGQLEPLKRSKIAVTNRVWQNRKPQNATDLTFHMVLADKAKVRAGALAEVSQWRFTLERIRFSVSGNTLVIEAPQSKARTKLKFRSWACGREAPAPFDLCLELSHRGRKMRLYSRSASRFGGLQAVDSPLSVTPLVLSDESVACTDCVEGEIPWVEALFAQ